MSTPKIALGRSPLTDPRALSSSMVFHVALLLIASAAVVGIAAPGASGPPQAILGEIGPVDNRAGESGGGGAGDLGGMGTAERVAVSAEGGARDKDAENELLSDILPAPAASDTSPRALPGPATTGLGTLPGLGTGGGGGSGGGSGGGIGRGSGPGTKFFGTEEHAGSFAYVIDCSGSMQSRGSLDIAKRELMASLAQLPPDARFSVVFYNLRANVFSDPQGRRGLMPATAANKERVRSLLSEVVPDGGTDHMLALRTAFDLRPEVIYFLSDGDLMSSRDVVELKADSGPSRVHAIEFGLGEDLREVGPLHRLATLTGGSFRYIDVRKFTRPAVR